MTEIISLSLDDETVEKLSHLDSRKRSKYIRDLIKANTNILPDSITIMNGLTNKDFNISEFIEFTRICNNICEAQVG